MHPDLLQSNMSTSQVAKMHSQVLHSRDVADAGVSLSNSNKPNDLIQVSNFYISNNLEKYKQKA